MNKLMFNAAERQVIDAIKQPVLLRKKLIYGSLKELQSELMSLYNGPGRPTKVTPPNFEV